jgi:hypothetical protein
MQDNRHVTQSKAPRGARGLKTQSGALKISKCRGALEKLGKIKL